MSRVSARRFPARQPIGCLPAQRYQGWRAGSDQARSAALGACAPWRRVRPASRPSPSPNSTWLKISINFNVNVGIPQALCKPAAAAIDLRITNKSQGTICPQGLS